MSDTTLLPSEREELENLRRWVGSEIFRSDHASASALREAMERHRADAERYKAALKELVEALDAVDVTVGGGEGATFRAHAAIAKSGEVLK